MSVDNVFNFWFTPESLVRLLADVGFTSVLQCYAPTEPHKPRNRVTLVAFKGEPVQISSYPWLNGLSEEQIGQQLRPIRPRKGIKRGSSARRMPCCGRWDWSCGRYRFRTGCLSLARHSVSNLVGR